ncbi:MAG: hypothetical protein CMJ36_06315 [Phycisphaerae bacterium]|nr:hypothetical protein [Phycisphaerae bacterium]
MRLTWCIMVMAGLLGTDAQVLRVPGDHATIQSAIEAADDGDTILVAPGRHAGGIDFLGKAVELVSEGGPDVTTIHGGCGGTVICIVQGEGAGALIEGFTISGGTGDPGPGGNRIGGAFRIEESSPTIRRCILVNNTADLGAAAWVLKAAPTFEGCWFDRNVSTLGAEIDCTGSEPRIIRCGFHDDGIAWRDTGAISIRDDCGDAGACCIAGACVMTTIDACEDARGQWWGDGVDCAGSPCPPPCPADVSGDGVVNMTDLLRVLDAWGWCGNRGVGVSP